MIGHISGTVLHCEAGYAIVETGGIGYVIYGTPETLHTLSVGDTATLWTHLAVREQALDLYGFARRGEKDVFELLLCVSGIGPKSALAVLSTADEDALRAAVHKNDPSHLVKVAGIGKKTAEKIVLELADKITGSDTDVGAPGDADALDALVSMGYSTREAREALKHAAPEAVDSSDRVRHALKVLGSPR